MNSSGAQPCARNDLIGATIDRALHAAGLAQPSTPGRALQASAEILPATGSIRDDKLLPALPPANPTQTGAFLRRSLTCDAGTRAYKLYVPSTYAKHPEKRYPLVVMLHGCTQSANDFAAGTRMNELAEQHGLLVAYPEQTSNANGSKCWNWFRPQDQNRESGEPSIIAGITCEIASLYRVDGRRVYVAGLSAGAAMAIVLGSTYPELYAAVGAHSGLAYRSASDIPSALSTMKGGRGAHGDRSFHSNLERHGVDAIPTIVFHGDSDQTVAVRNAEAIVGRAIGPHPNYKRFSITVREGATSGLRYTTTLYAAGTSPPLVEHWLIHGGSHAWSGGSKDGSFTDVRGPNASAEMIRFFTAHAR